MHLNNNSTDSYSTESNLCKYCLNEQNAEVTDTTDIELQYPLEWCM